MDRAISRNGPKNCFDTELFFLFFIFFLVSHSRESSKTLVYNIYIRAPHWLEEQSTQRGSSPTFFEHSSGTEIQ